MNSDEKRRKKLKKLIRHLTSPVVQAKLDAQARRNLAEPGRRHKEYLVRSKAYASIRVVG